MIRPFEPRDLDALMSIWLHTNIQAHAFVPEAYWRDHESEVRAMLPQAELYVFAPDGADEPAAFIGMTGDYIAGLFVKAGFQSRGIGAQLLRHVKGFKPTLRLNVYKENARAVAFYLREGFVPESEGLADGVPEITMVWRR